jgi:hypothetical protein
MFQCRQPEVKRKVLEEQKIDLPHEETVVRDH